MIDIVVDKKYNYIWTHKKTSIEIYNLNWLRSSSYKVKFIEVFSKDYLQIIAIFINIKICLMSRVSISMNEANFYFKRHAK